MVVSQGGGGVISRAAAGMSIHVGEELLPISKEAFNKEKPEKKVNNSDLRTNVFQEKWFVDKNSKTQRLASTNGNKQSSEVEGESEVKEKVVLKKDDKVAFRESDTVDPRYSETRIRNF